MEDSLKGMYITAGIVGLFIMAIFNFVVLFPQEQGVTFSGESGNAYMTVSSLNDTEVVENIQLTNNQSENAFNEWDVTTGFMGTNQLKQGQGGIKNSITNSYTSLKTVALELFTSGSPIVYALAVFFTLALGYLTYAIIKFVRTGN
jgi:hypothetical protein